MAEAKSLALNDQVFRTAFGGELAEVREKLQTCIQCGSCSASCPAVGLMDVTPRHLWQLIRWGLEDEAVATKAFWVCTQCYACTVRCPRGIITSENMRLLRKWQSSAGLEMPESVTKLRDTVTTSYNISGDDNARRLIWSENLDQAPASLQPRTGADYVLFTGCVSSFYPMTYSIPQAFVQILEKAGISYTTMGGEEWCCGYPLYGVGMESEMVDIARHNVSRFLESGAKKLVTTCPSCYYTWAHIYHEVVPESRGIQVLHATELLAELVHQGKLAFKEQPPAVVTYHDPCDLGRKSGVYDAPRAIINSIPGLKLVEMANARESALCCGGGGDVEMVNAQAVEELAAQRMAQVRDTGAKLLISSCQQCKRTLFRSARNTKTRVRVLDITELVLDALA
ncbi:MAG: (Fe-S)-binding protein [Chloroflexi bacterium]|nr:(Fe-S)-binding protein [Chloroflexota bacterium]